MESASCPICTKPIATTESFNKLTVKGIVSLLEASTKRPTAIAADDTDILCMALDSKPETSEKLYIIPQHKPKKVQEKFGILKKSKPSYH